MKITSISHLRDALLLDSQRYRMGGGKAVVKNLMIPGFRFSFFLRICQYLKYRTGFLYLPFYMLLRHYKYKYGFEIHPSTHISPGFYLGHFGGVVINQKARIGFNVNISHGVTIGSNNRGTKCGYPKIGNNVWIGPGAKIVGRITVGNNVAIAPNAVVINDVPDNCCLGGVPARIISEKGAGAEYIQNPIDIKEYEKGKQN